MRRHILPNVMPLVWANSVLIVALAMLGEAGLSYFGLGDPDAFSWGTLLYNGFQAGAINAGRVVVRRAARHRDHAPRAGVLRRRPGHRGCRRSAAAGRAVSDDPCCASTISASGYRSGGGDVEIVSGVSFELRRGEALGIAGESGCGKTTTALAIMQLLAPGVRQLSGTIDLATEDGVVQVQRRTERGMRDLRWSEVSLVFQGALNALNPVQRISRQIGDAIRLHDPAADRTAVRDSRARAARARGHRARDRADQYPHEFSDGMRQRVMIALALACDPQVVIADEPTTALDVMTQAQVLALLEELRRDLGLALLLITHDLGVIAETCDRVAMMYAGAIVESGPTETVFACPAAPLHPAAARRLPADRRASAACRRRSRARRPTPRIRRPAAASTRAATSRARSARTAR